MGTLNRATECLVQLTRMGLGAVQAGGQVVATLWGQGQVKQMLIGHLPLFLEQLRHELDREYRRGHTLHYAAQGP